MCTNLQVTPVNKRIYKPLFNSPLWVIGQINTVFI